MNPRHLAIFWGTTLAMAGALPLAWAQPENPPREQGAPSNDRNPVEERRPREGRPRRMLDQPPPGDREIEAPREGPRDGPPRDPKMLREMIDRGLDESARATRRFEEARKMLDDGRPPEEVVRFLRESRGGMLADRFVDRFRRGERPEPPAPLFDREQGQGRPMGGPDDKGPEGKGPEGKGPDGRPGPGMNPEQHAELMKFIREVRPDFADRLEQWKKNEPGAFRAIMGRLVPKAIDAFRARNDDKELYELRKNDLRATILVVEKAHELRRWQMEHKGEAVPPEKKSELRELMGKGYDARTKVREYEAQQLANRLESTKKQIQEAKDARESLLDRAVDEVLKGPPRRGPQGEDGPEGRPLGDDAKRPLGSKPDGEKPPKADQPR
jgi:hypothetical protein